MEFTLDHIGWITYDLAKFESFWCDILGFKLVKEAFVAPAMAAHLFEEGPASIKRYARDDWDMDIEIHQFKHKTPEPYGFARFGINHICIHTGGPGSKQEFVNSLPSHVERHVYNNPGGWSNIFLRDFEGNWIELRENL